MVLNKEVASVNKLGLLALAAIGIGFPSGAGAQSFGPYSSARILPVEGRSAGFYLTGSESNTGLMSQLRLSFYPGVDFGFQGGLARLESSGSDRTLVQVGADVRIGVAQMASGAPFDLALGGGFGIDTGDDYSVLSLGPMAFASRSFPAGASGSLAPYTVAGVAFSSASAGGENRSEVTLPVNLGLEFRPHTALSITSELQVRLASRYRDDFGLGIGVAFAF